MITKTKLREKTVSAKSAEEFDRLFEKQSELIGDDYELQWDSMPLTVHFIYKETVRIPETVADEYEMRGERYYCKDCPYFGKHADGRRRNGGCKYSEHEVVDYTPACELFYKRYAKGEIDKED